MTAPWVFLAICLAGGLGAALRYAVDAAITPRLAARTAASLPVATAIINVSGSFGLGVLLGAAAGAGLPSDWLLIGGGGLMGGFTTFSTASVEAVRLVQKRRYGAAIVTVLGVVVLAVAAAALGMVLGAVFCDP